MTAVATQPIAPATERRNDGAVHAPVGRMATRGALILLIAGALIGWRRAERPYADGDILWSIRTGTRFLHNGQLAFHDPYSWTAHGTAWVQNSWGWNVVLALAYRAGGFVGIALLGVVLTSTIALLVGVLARRRGAAEPMSAMLTLIVCGLFSLWMYARPQLVDLVAVLGLMLLLPAVFEREGRPAVRRAAVVVALQVGWMNLHSTALVGPVLILAFGVGRLAMDASRRRGTTVRAGALTLAGAVACLATPYGLTPIRHANEVRAASVGLIAEWLPVGIGSPEQLLGLLAVALGAVAGLVAWRARRLDTLAVLLVFGVACGTAIRFAPLLVVTALPELAAGCERLPVRAVMMRRAWWLTASVIAALCAVGSSSFGEPGLRNDSPELIGRLPTGCRLLNDIDVGGAVILRRPDVPVSIDSRNDLYGRSREVESLRVLYLPAIGRRYVAAHDVSCVLAPMSMPTVRALAHDPAWRVAGADGVRVLLLRR